MRPSASTSASGAGRCAGSRLTSGLARGLSLAAAPTFALMAALSASEPAAGMICSGMPMHGPAGMSGMAAMYLLMSLFHAGPWLRWIGGEGGFRAS